MRYHVLATMAVATLLLVGALGQDSGKSESTDQRQQQSTDTGAMKGMTGKEQMAEAWKDQDAELDKLIAEMNSASGDNKLEAIAALLTKLVEQRKAMHEQIEKMLSANGQEGMDMCRTMMMRAGKSDDASAAHAHHH
jgi:hypothetical protein